MEMSGVHVYGNTNLNSKNQVNTGGTSAEEEGIYEQEDVYGNDQIYKLPDFKNMATVIPSTGQEAGTLHTHQTRSRYCTHTHTPDKKWVQLNTHLIYCTFQRPLC